MSKERLEEIIDIVKEATRHFRNNDSRHFAETMEVIYKAGHLARLIEQAERAQLLEESFGEENRLHLKANEDANRLDAQSRRYREAMTLARSFIEYGRTDKEERIYNTLGQALEGESE